MQTRCTTTTSTNLEGDHYIVQIPGNSFPPTGCWLVRHQDPSILRITCHIKGSRSQGRFEDIPKGSFLPTTSCRFDGWYTACAQPGRKKGRLKATSTVEASNNIVLFSLSFSTNLLRRPYRRRHSKIEETVSHGSRFHPAQASSRILRTT
jgi:hypothetical protein